MSVAPYSTIIQNGQQPLVIKIGSSLLVQDDQPRVDWMQALATELIQRPGPVVLVSSGAIALGRTTLGLDRKPTNLAESQAAAAVGQIQLAQRWAETWHQHGRQTAQVLLTLDDLEDRGRYLNARNTIETLLGQSIVPIINENDTVATGEIRFGDNDRLAARVAQLTQAELLVLLSDVDGLHTANPEMDQSARLIPDVKHIDASIDALADDGSGTNYGTGGMRSKLTAARIATAAGCPVLLTSGLGEQAPLSRYAETGRGTHFAALDQPRILRKQWLQSLQQHAGRVHLDAGACAALEQGGSLLAVGLTAVDGPFERGSLVGLIGPNGPIGQGLSGYSYDEASRLIGLKSDAFMDALGYAGRGPIVHRDDLVLFEG